MKKKKKKSISKIISLIALGSSIASLTLIGAFTVVQKGQAMFTGDSSSGTILERRGGELSGKYMCKGGKYANAKSYEFKSNGTVYWTMKGGGMKIAYKYVVDGDNVIIGDGNNGMVLTKSGNTITLDVPELGFKCTLQE